MGLRQGRGTHSASATTMHGQREGRDRGLSGCLAAMRDDEAVTQSGQSSVVPARRLWRGCIRGVSSNDEMRTTNAPRKRVSLSCSLDEVLEDSLGFLAPGICLLEARRSEIQVGSQPVGDDGFGAGVLRGCSVSVETQDSRIQLTVPSRSQMRSRSESAASVFPLWTRTSTRTSIALAWSLTDPRSLAKSTACCA
jgi:hypothetical protein